MREFVVLDLYQPGCMTGCLGCFGNHSTDELSAKVDGWVLEYGQLSVFGIRQAWGIENGDHGDDTLKCLCQFRFHADDAATRNRRLDGVQVGGILHGMFERVERRPRDLRGPVETAPSDFPGSPVRSSSSRRPSGGE